MNTLQNYQPPANLLENKIILVTGAGSGIGKTAAIAYAKHGATVILLGKTVEKLEGTYDEIEQLGYPQPAILPMDLASDNEADYESLATAIDESFGQLDGLLHNAALLGERTSIGSYTLKSWNKLMAVNVTAPFLLTKKLLPLLHKSPHSSIIFTGSSVGLRGRAYWGAYSVSKAANENLMQILADELEDVSHIRCNSINPGATRTPMRADAYPAENPNTVKSPESLIPLYLYLMGEDSSQVNGQQFNG